MKKTIPLFLITLLATPLLRAEPAGWGQVPEILARIQAPVFPARDFVITNYGAVADGQTDCTAAIDRTIKACAKDGGGRVVVPAGEFFTGPIHLLSNLELHLEAGATLKFSTDPKACLPAVLTRFEGMECWNYSPLIYAYGQENIAVTGEGTLDGQADAARKRGPVRARGWSKWSPTTRRWISDVSVKATICVRISSNSIVVKMF